MKVLVCVKRVLDFNIKARVKSDESGIDLSNVKMSMNPFDEIAVEEAVRLKEAGTVSEVVIASIGEPSSQEVIRTALALGGDRGILVETSEEIQPLSAAKIFKALADKESPEIILLGKQAIDDDCNQTGQMLASLLNWSQGTFASKIELTSKAATVTREIDGGLETLSCTLPTVLTTDLRLNTPRYPKLPNIMKAKQKPLETLLPSDLGVDVKASQKTLKVCEPPTRQGGRKVKDVQELLSCLRNDAKVI